GTVPQGRTRRRRFGRVFRLEPRAEPALIADRSLEHELRREHLRVVPGELARLLELTARTADVSTTEQAMAALEERIDLRVIGVDLARLVQVAAPDDQNHPHHAG